MDNILLELLPGLVLFVIIPILILIVLIPLAIKEYKKKSQKHKINKEFYKYLGKNYSNDFNDILNQIYNDSTKVTLENGRKKYLVQTYIIIVFILICIFSMLYNVILFSKFTLELIIVKVLIEIIGMVDDGTLLEMANLKANVNHVKRIK